MAKDPLADSAESLRSLRELLEGSAELKFSFSCGNCRQKLKAAPPFDKLLARQQIKVRCPRCRHIALWQLTGKTLPP